ncbi:hypothetical protein [Paraburkholderia sp.]|uniref:hypothetical protein n=1 Tax=Paraburkholderia sp. TaxID=1926495 RepID=UPI0039E4EDA3
MFKALRLSDAGVKAARKHEAIIGKPVMARGAFSAVFDNGNTVYKLTLDRFAYLLGCDRQIGCSGRHFTEVLHSFDEVGEVDGHPLYLFECEKLERLPKTGEVRALARRVVRRCPSVNGLRCLETLANDDSLPTSLCEAFEDLRVFATNVEDGWGVDIHSANLMVRPADGELVLSDPLADWGTSSSLTARRRFAALN